MHSTTPQSEARTAALHARIRRLRRTSLLLLAISACVGVPATFLWGKGGYAMFGDAERTSKSVVLLGLGAGACALLAAFLALRVSRLSDQLPRGG